MTRRGGQPYLRILKLVLVLGILFFLGRTLLSHADELSGAELRISPLPLAAGFLVMTATYFYIALIWHLLSRSFGVSTGYAESLYRWSGSQFARYIPGTVFILLTRFVGYRDRDYPKSMITSAFLLENAVVAWSALLVFLLFGWSLIPEGSWLRWLSLLALPAGTAAVIPGIPGRAVNLILRLAGREAIGMWPDAGCMIRCLLLGLLAFVQAGAGFWLIVSSVHPVGISDLPLVTGAFAGMGVVNLMVFFVPGGLGARDGALALFLSSMLPVAGAILMALVCRVVMTLMEVIVFLTGWLLFRRERSRVRREDPDGRPEPLE